METTQAIAALAALAQEHRLAVFRLLVQAGPEGMPAGQVAEALDLAPNTLTFHFDRLRHGGSRDGPARRPLDDLRGALRSDECAARLPDRELLRRCCRMRACRLRPENCHTQDEGEGARMSAVQSTLPVAVIGGGPVGLAAAAHLVTRGLPVKLYEAGATVAAHVRDWGHVRLFSPWGFNTDAAATAILREHGWQAPPATALPTGDDLYSAYLQPLAETPPLQARDRNGRARAQRRPRRHRQGRQPRDAPTIRSRSRSTRRTARRASISRAPSSTPREHGRAPIRPRHPARRRTVRSHSPTASPTAFPTCSAAIRRPMPGSACSSSAAGIRPQMSCSISRASPKRTDE